MNIVLWKRRISLRNLSQRCWKLSQGCWRLRNDLRWLGVVEGWSSKCSSCTPRGGRHQGIKFCKEMSTMSNAFATLNILGVRTGLTGFDSFQSGNPKGIMSHMAYDNNINIMSNFRVSRETWLCCLALWHTHHGLYRYLHFLGIHRYIST